MILKYKVLPIEKEKYKKKYLYCKVNKIIKSIDTPIFLYNVKCLNYYNIDKTFINFELKRCNIIDRIKIFFGGLK